MPFEPIRIYFSDLRSSAGVRQAITRVFTDWTTGVFRLYTGHLSSERNRVFRRTYATSYRSRLLYIFRTPTFYILAMSMRLNFRKLVSTCQCLRTHYFTTKPTKASSLSDSDNRQAVQLAPTNYKAPHVLLFRPQPGWRKLLFQPLTTKNICPLFLSRAE